VNGNLYADELDYEFVGEEPTWWLGPDYLPLRREIREFATREPSRRDPAERAIVTFGGSDPSGLTPVAVRAFDGLGLRVDAIVGPGASATLEADVREAAAETDADVRVVRDPTDLPERMFEADLAVTACGSTTYELLALGTPMVAVPVVVNQEPIGRALEGRDLATVLAPDCTPADVRAAVRPLLDDPERRRERCRAGRALIDGNGSYRIAGTIADTRGGRG
jgi:spore coat polysaccharide biosynthesis predicted glycosyltransferase SpsG